MIRVFALVAVVVGICFLCSCVGKFSLIDRYYTTGEEEEVVEEKVEEVTPPSELVESEGAVEVIEEPLK